MDTITSSYKRIREYSFDRLTWFPIDDSLDELLQTDIAFYWNTIHLSNKVEDTIKLPKQIRTRIRNACLRHLQVKTLGDFLRRDYRDIEHSPGFGHLALSAVNAVLEDKGLKMGMVIRERTEKSLKMRNREVTFNKFMEDLEQYIQEYFFTEGKP